MKSQQAFFTARCWPEPCPPNCCVPGSPADGEVLQRVRWTHGVPTGSTSIALYNQVEADDCKNDCRLHVIVCRCLGSV